METVSLKRENKSLDELEKELFNSPRLMIKKLSASEKKRLSKAVAKLQGASPRRTTDEQIHIARERVFDFLEKRFKNK